MTAKTVTPVPLTPSPLTPIPIAPGPATSRPAQFTPWYDPRRALALPHAYRALMKLLGADAALSTFVRDVLCVSPGDRILDLGCGPGRLAARLPGCEYRGIDQDPRYVARARRARPHANFLCVNLTGLRPNLPSGCFQVAVALGLLHHLTDAQAKSVVEVAHRALAPGGRLITVDCAFVPGQHPIAETLACFDRGRYVRRPGRYLELAAAHFETARVTVRHDLLRVPYSHAIVECVK